MSDFPALEQFPDESADIADVSTYIRHEGFGILAAQDGDRLYQVTVQIALSPDPRDGFVAVSIDAAGARDLAAHLTHLAKYAELGVEAERPNE